MLFSLRGNDFRPSLNTVSIMATRIASTIQSDPNRCILASHVTMTSGSKSIPSASGCLQLIVHVVTKNRYTLISYLCSDQSPSINAVNMSATCSSSQSSTTHTMSRHAKNACRRVERKSIVLALCKSCNHDHNSVRLSIQHYGTTVHDCALAAIKMSTR